ncbi:MAG TPA: hypothetical protein VLZ83_04220 [Edaphocola sp.]|nr:hypothetical protein [Edaphocola sp.]
MLRLFISLFITLSFLFIIPYFANTPLFVLPKLQPDLGYGLIIGVIISILSAFIQNFIKGNVREQNNNYS